jgi:hypothetical protein
MNLSPISVLAFLGAWCACQEMWTRTNHPASLLFLDVYCTSLLSLLLTALLPRMRLINVKTYEIREFFGKIPKYAIVSHTWGAEEVTLQDMTELNAATQRNAFDNPNDFHIFSKQGYEKNMYTCWQSREDDLSWAWVDTCCIDKTSSAELSEAINSMYQ